MKKSIASAVVGAALTLASMNASAIMIGTTEVGGFDTFVASGALANSGLGTEVFFINASLMLLPSLTQADIFQAQAGTDVDEFCDDGGRCFVDFGPNTSPAFFMLKFGNSPNYPDHYLYRNDGALGARFGVYSRLQNGLGNTDCGGNQNLRCIQGLSHVTLPAEGGRPPSEVPAPGVLGLLAAGLLGMAARARRS